VNLTLVDTDLLIDLASKNTQAVNCLKHLEQQSILAVSTITEMELIVGCRNKTELRKTIIFWNGLGSFL